MQSFIESLESRTLMSVAPALGQLQADAKVVISDLAADAKVGKANVKLIYSDLKADGELKSSKALLKTLTVEGVAAFAVTARAIAVTKTALFVEVSRLVATAKLLAKHPTNATLAAKVSADDSALSLEASNRLATITADGTAEHEANGENLTNLVDANPSNTQLANDAQNTIDPNSVAARTALLNAVTTVLTTDVAAVVAAFPG